MNKFESNISGPGMNSEISHFSSLEEALYDLYGSEVSIQKKEAVYRGDINEAYCLTLSNGEKVFLKKNTMANQRFFITEAHGLQALSSAGTIGVPRVYGTGSDKRKGYSFLLMEHLGSKGRVKDYWEIFGRELALLHKSEIKLPMDIGAVGTEEKTGHESANTPAYGFFEDNYIGANPQKNDWKTSWTCFFRDCRLIPQIRMAEHMMDYSLKRKLDRLLSHLDQYLREPDMPSILHGDLWSGNAICGPDGKAWIIDPAVYVGDRETDLAMTQLFGGFPSAFYSSYHETFPIDPEYKDRRHLYDLYHILNHANLFGRGYLSQASDILNYYAN